MPAEEQASSVAEWQPPEPRQPRNPRAPGGRSGGNWPPLIFLRLPGYRLHSEKCLAESHISKVTLQSIKQGEIPFSFFFWVLKG